MSFYKITDPKERRRMFEKLTQTRKKRTRAILRGQNR